MNVSLQYGLSAADRRRAAELYWQAFGGKLSRVMGPEPLALVFLERVMRADHAIAALDEHGRLVGLAGFKTPSGGFAGGTSADMRAVYGRWGGLWRAALLRLLQGDVDNERFLLDGICVAREVRSHGIGTALLAEICAEAIRRGYSAVRLDVVDSNWRARALYERLGFVATQSHAIGALSLIFGFKAAITMVRQVR
ncbi:acetyltransferase (GNAT) family protein [Cereibacter ovatus]|uniref:Acetyltransferase (GNAT) family protein n=1 Tax=Cereibacter ovatus TaxID=439529 RepID=A0A285CM44_9RHOB|nr:GNAT family N-acetyltransferase [Cereibacter ovatus]SNX68612.1 acetyltransferase (GNAT) family protein [Cereibacter ovatus]